MILISILAWVQGTKPVIPPPPDEPLYLSSGWVDDQDAVRAVHDTHEFKSFGETPAGRAVRGPEPKEVFLWNAYRKLFGRNLTPKNQGGVGCCVGDGTTGACEVTLAVQVANGENQEYHDLVEEVTYGGSRVQIGGGRISGDGSVGAWAAEYVKKYGLLARGTYGRYDLNKFSESRAREFGRTGVPRELEAEVAKNPVGDAVLVKTTAELRKAHSQGYCAAICSSQGYSSTRDADGFASPRGTWMHCMYSMGYRSDRPGFFIMNSWGPTWNSGPKGIGDPPDGGFWADEKVVARMLAQNDSWAFSSVKGFPAKEIDFRIFAPDVRPARPRELFAKRLNGVFAMAP